VQVLALGLVLRLVWTAAVPVVPVFDCRWYDQFARNLANGEGYGFGPGAPTAFWPVGPSFLYSLVYRAVGVHVEAAALFNVVVALVGIWFAMRFAELCFGRRIAVLTGLLLAVWPEQIEFVTVLSSELAFNLFLLMWVVAWRSESRGLRSFWVRGTLMGAAGAAACYMRPVGLLLPAVLLGIDLVRSRRMMRPVATAAVSCAVMLALIAPWTLRNWRELHGFAPISTNGGLNLYEGNHAGPFGEADALPEATDTMTEMERDRYGMREGLGYIRSHPGVFVERTAVKVYMLYSRENYGVYWNRPALLERYGRFGERAARVVSDAFWFAALGLSVAGLNWLRQRSSLRNVVTHPCFLICAYFSGVYAVTHAVDRFHFACVPFLAVMAALAVDALVAGREVDAA
jgi:hypothetical protein